MNITFNDKIQLKDIQDLRKLYNFMYGYMQGIFETRYTCKINMEDRDNYFIVTNYDGSYQINEYRKSSHEPVIGLGHPEFSNLQDCIKYLIREV